MTKLSGAGAFTHTYVRVLSIAGSDSGGGAGIQADLKTFAALGCYGMTAITALTAQNTCGVQAVDAVSAAMLRAQIDAVLQDLGAHAVKIGMLANAEQVDVVAQALAHHGAPHVVLDPVMAATSGTPLSSQAASARLVSALLPQVALVTPNLDEASWLVGRPVRLLSDMGPAAQALLALGAQGVLLKGGHLPGEAVSDLLATADGGLHWMHAPRIASANTHGTGCTLSSAIAAHLALGAALPQAVDLARQYVRATLQAGASVHTGACSGPLNHGYAPLATQLRPLV